MTDEQGSISSQVLILIFFIAVLLSAAIPFLTAGIMQCQKVVGTYSAQKQLETEVENIISMMETDRTPDEDWRGDPVHVYIKNIDSSVKITINDASSKINPNFMRKKMFEQTHLRTLLRPNSSTEMLQQYRFDHGPTTDRAQYDRFFRPETAPYLTYVGWANINTTDEFMLLKLYEEYTGSLVDGEAFHEKVTLALENKLVFDEESFFIYFGEYAKKIWPIINTQPWFNVNYVDSSILEALIKYPDYAIEDSDRKIHQLLQLRDEKEVTQWDILSVLGVGTEHPLMQYLCGATSLWEIKALKKESCYTVLLARSLNSKNIFHATDAWGGRRFRIIERSFTP